MLTAHWEVAVLAFMTSVAACDLIWRRIPHWYTLSAIAVSLGYHWMAGSLASAMVAAVAGWLLGLSLFALSGIGGGDVMLFSVMGAALGFSLWLRALALTFILAGIIGLVMVLHRRILGQTLANMGAVLKHVACSGLHPHPEINLDGTSGGVAIPLGLPAAVATLAVVLSI